MMSDGAKRLQCFLQLIVALLIANKIFAASSTASQQNIAWRRYDLSYLLSLDNDRHSEQPDENNAPNPSLLTDLSMMPSSSPTVPATMVKSLCEAENGSFGDTTKAENDKIPYKYEVRYKKVINGMDVEASDIISAIEIALSNTMLPSLFSKCGIDMNNVSRRTNVIGQDSTTSGDSTRPRLLVNVHNRRLGEIIGMNATPKDRETKNKCSRQVPAETECKIVEGMMTLFLSDSNDRESIILSTIVAIQNSMESGSMISAHQSILSILYLDDNRDENIYIDDTLGGPDEADASVSSAAVITSAVAAIIALMAAGGVYLQRKRCKKGDASEQRSDNQDSISVYEDTMGGSIS